MKELIKDVHMFMQYSLLSNSHRLTKFDIEYKLIREYLNSVHSLKLRFNWHTSQAMQLLENIKFIQLILISLATFTFCLKSRTNWHFDHKAQTYLVNEQISSHKCMS